MSEDRELEGDQIIRMDPILGRLPDKRALAPSSTRVALDRVPACAHKVVQVGQLDNQRVPVVLIEWTLFEVVLHKRRLERQARLFLQ